MGTTNAQKNNINDDRLFSVVLPTFNEKNNIIPLVEAIFMAVPYAEIIVVDDNSPDRTWKIVQDYAKIHDNISLIRRIGKKGLVSALNDGIALAKGSVIGWMDCDFSMPPEHYIDLLKKIDDGFDIAVASRFVSRGGVEIITGSPDTIMAFLMSLFLNRFVRFMLDSNIKDYTSGFICIKKDILDNTPLKGDYGEYFIELIYRAKKMGYRIIEVPYLCRARTKGTSKTGTNIFHYLKKGVKYILVTLKLKFSRIKKVRRQHG
jgi:dolichol-phosphate mannosyltransferase